MRRSLAVTLLYALVLIACTPSSPTPTPSPTPSPTRAFTREVAVYPDEVHQTLKDVAGGNFIHRFGGVREALDPVSTYTLEHLGPRYVRVGMTLEDWEPVNDDGDPTTFAWDGFEARNFIPATMGFLQVMRDRTDAPTIASTWDVPDWMVTNPRDDRERKLDPALYPEVVESLAAWLVHARDAYGVEVAYVSFNEATLGVNVRLSPQEYIDLIKVAGPRFAALDLPTRWLLGDCHNMAICASYVRKIWADPEVRPYLGPVAFHSWDADVADHTLQEIAQVAAEIDREVWCTEAGWDAQLWQTPDQFPTWYNAISLATIYGRVLKLSDATVLQYWQMMGHDYNLNDGTEGFPVFALLQQYAEQFPPGTQIVGTSPDANGLYAVAAQAPEHVVVQLINGTFIDMPTQVTGLPDGTYVHIRSSTDEVTEQIATFEVRDGTLQLTLTRGSVNLLTTRPP